MLNELDKLKVLSGGPGESYRVVEGIICKDGFKMSVQGSQTHYCTPRSMIPFGMYISLEVGFPSVWEPLLMEYAEEPENPTRTVYGWVPTHIINAIIVKHGGIDWEAIRERNSGTRAEKLWLENRNRSEGEYDAMRLEWFEDLDRDEWNRWDVIDYRDEDDNYDTLKEQWEHLCEVIMSQEKQ
jgi:hypothetical protein